YHPVADAVPGRARRRAVDLPAGGPPGAGGRPGHAGPGRAGGSRLGGVPPVRGVGGPARRTWGTVVGGDTAGGDRRRCGGGGRARRGGEARAARLLSWLDQADRSSGSRKPVLAVGRDGLMLPIRGQACYREGATATVSVYDRAGRRLGTVYLGRMPEPGQGTLSGQLTALIEAVLRAWDGPLPRLAYITDGG